MKLNHIFLDDNLECLREHFDDRSIDLIYLDPPFNSKRDYLLLSGEHATGPKGKAPVFRDVWKWSQQNQVEFDTMTSNKESQLSCTVKGLHMMIGPSPMLSYLLMLATRLIEMHRVLKASGSIFVHCDTHASAYLKVLMDGVFGEENFLNCIVWCYGLGGSSPRYFPRKHDDVLWYSRNQNQHYFLAPSIPATSQKMKGLTKKAPDYWMIPTINNMANERCGYPTQKPEALLERIISSASREGDVILDPFCGSGTTLVVAKKLNRRWIGIDSNSIAVETSRQRTDHIAPSRSK